MLDRNFWKGVIELDRDQKYRLVKRNYLISFLVILVLFTILFWWNNRADENSFENLGSITAQTSLYDKKRSLPTTTNGQLADAQEETDVATETFFNDPTNLVKYFWDLAILGKQDEFYDQFDPNVQMADFPNVQDLKRQQTNYFDQLTHNGTLQHIKMKQTGISLTDTTNSITTTLIYRDGRRKDVRVKLGSLQDAHGDGSSEWYIKSSVHDLVNQAVKQ
jgi:hypothetical protein